VGFVVDKCHWGRFSSSTSAGVKWAQSYDDTQQINVVVVVVIPWTGDQFVARPLPTHTGSTSVSRDNSHSTDSCTFIISHLGLVQ
jgi:hypothetical protein